MRCERTPSELQNRHRATYSLKLLLLAAAAAAKDSSATSTAAGQPPQSWKFRTAIPLMDWPHHAQHGQYQLLLCACCSKPGPTHADKAAWALPLLQNAKEPKQPLCLEVLVEDKTSALSTADKNSAGGNLNGYSVKTPVHLLIIKQCSSCPFWRGLQEPKHSNELDNRIICFRKPSQAITPKKLQCCMLETGQTVTEKEHNLI